MCPICAAATLAFAFSVSAPAAAQDAEQDAEQEVRAAWTAWNDAIRTKDVAVLEQVMAPEFSLATGDGTDPLPRAAWFANLGRMELRSYTPRIVDLRLHGPFAVVTVEGEWDVSFGPNSVRERFLVRDFWVRRGNGWMVFRRHRPE